MTVDELVAAYEEEFGTFIINKLEEVIELEAI